jgi:hypothetical protein
MGGLFDEHGAPLVVKCDNGSAFISDAFQAFLAERGVLLLYSPPRKPAYNGAVERANGVLKTYTQQHAAAEAHPFRWTSDDVEAARQLANTMSRPWGYRGVTPDEAWRARKPIGDEQRQAFQAAAERERLSARGDLGLPPTGELSRDDQARLDRLALQRALCALDYLEMHRADRPKKAKRLSRAELAKRAAETASASDITRPAPSDASPPPGDSAPDAPASFASGAPTSSESYHEAVASKALDTATAPESGVESNNKTMNTRSKAAAPENEKSQLAPPMAADTMRAEADGEPGARAGPSPPAPADVEPAKPPWPLRFIAPLFARLKAAMIS